MSIKINRQNLIRLILFMATFFLLINASTIYSYYFVLISNICLVLSGILTILAFVLSKKIFFSTRTLALVIIWLLTIVFTALVSGINISVLNYIFKFLIAFLIVMLVKINNLNLFKILYNLVKIFAVWALINYIITIFKISFLPITNQYPTWWGGTYDLHLFLFFKNISGKLTFGGITITRLHSPFSEPGVIQIFFNLGVFYILFMEKHQKKDFGWLLFFISLILLSTSLMGYVILAFLIFIYLIQQKKTLALCITTIVCMIIVIPVIIQKLSSISYDDRTSDYAFIFSSAFKNLPFGVGLGNAEDAGTRVDVVTGEIVQGGFFSGLFSPLVYLGFLSIVFYYVLFLSIRYVERKKNKFTLLAFASVVIITLLTEPLSFTTLFALLFSNGFVNKGCRNYVKEKRPNLLPITDKGI